MTNTIIADNSAADGGGVNDGDGAYIKYTGDTISGNRARGDGGGINASSGGVPATGTIFFHSHAGGHGGRIDSSTTSVSGYPPSVSFTDSIISGNLAGARGGGVYNQGSLDASSTKITGNRAVGGGGGIFDDGTEATVTLTHSSPTGNEPDNCEPLGSIIGCTG
jgi:hypothetical protein